MPTNAELGHKEMAEEIVKQTLTGTFPRPTVAAKAVGYAADSSGHSILKRNSFFKALWNQVPYDLIAYMQKAQLKAINIRKLKWSRDIEPQEATDILHNEGLRVLRVWCDRDGVLITMYAEPNWDYVDRALDKLYKLGGFYAAEKHEHNVSRPLEELSDQELEEMVGQGVDKTLSSEDANVVQSVETIDIPQQ